jgi:hypothetical protein
MITIMSITRRHLRSGKSCHLEALVARCRDDRNEPGAIDEKVSQRLCNAQLRPGSLSGCLEFHVHVARRGLDFRTVTLTGMITEANDPRIDCDVAQTRSRQRERIR